MIGAVVVLVVKIFLVRKIMKNLLSRDLLYVLCWFFYRGFESRKKKTRVVENPPTEEIVRTRLTVLREQVSIGKRNSRRNVSVKYGARDLTLNITFCSSIVGVRYSPSEIYRTVAVWAS